MFHPFLASAPDAFLCLVRAYVWQILDADFNHADYWRDQVAQAEKAFTQDIYTKNVGRPVKQETVRQLNENAMRSAFEICNKRRRVWIEVPESVLPSFYGVSCNA